MTVHGGLVSGHLGIELSENRAQIAAFLRTEPDFWQTPQGSLMASERRQRLEMAKKFARDHVKDWLTERGMDLEILVDMHPGLNRLEFCQELVGDWIPQESGDRESHSNSPRKSEENGLIDHWRPRV